MRTLRPQGMTLVEVLITLAIFTVMLEAIYASLIISQRTWTNYTQDIAPKQQLRLAMTLMVNELREASDAFIVKDRNGVQLTFHRPVAGEIKYTWTNTGEDANKIIRSNYEHKKTMAYNITSVEFSLTTAHEIIIEIGGEHKDVKLKEKVAFRSQTGPFIQSENEKIK